MCGRFFRHEISWEEYLSYLNLFEWGEVRSTSAAYNIAPTQTVPIIRIEPDVGQLVLAPAMWGLVPRWWKKPLSEKKFSTFNAKGEEVAEKATFRTAWKDRPCLVPMSGFYEWKTEASGKQPFAIGLRNRRLFFAAGLWDRATVDGASLDSFTILTTGPNSLMADIHNRMPVIPRQDQIRDWLAGSPDERAAMIEPHDSDDMQAWKVGKAVGNVRNQGPGLIEPEAQ